MLEQKTAKEMVTWLEELGYAPHLLEPIKSIRGSTWVKFIKSGLGPYLKELETHGWNRLETQQLGKDLSDEYYSPANETNGNLSWAADERAMI